MSVDLETLLREAAAGPEPEVGTADLRRRGARRRRLMHAAGAAGIAATVVVAGVGVAAVAGTGAVPTPEVAGTPDVPSPGPSTSDQDGSPPLDDFGAVDGAPVDMVVEEHGDRCQLRVIAHGPDGTREGALWLPYRNAVLCGHELPEDVALEEPPAPELLTLRAPALDGSFHPEQLLAGLVFDDVAAVRVRTDQVDVTVRTVEVEAPGTIDVRAYAVWVPVADGADVPEDRRFTAVDADGRAGPEAQPTFALFDLAWSDGPPLEPGFATTGQPIDDLPMELPDEVPPFGTWRPERSPVDLSPLTMRNTADAWFDDDDPYGPRSPADREAVAARLGGESQLEELCDFLRDTYDHAVATLGLQGEPPEVVAETLMYLVFTQEDVRSGGTETIAHVCGLPSMFDGPS